MASQIIICITLDIAFVAVIRDDVPVDYQNFHATDEGFRTFGDFLKAHDELPIHLMVDSVEEDYHMETLPHVGGSARHELVNRKLRQVYRNGFFCAAWIQGRDAGKRRDDHYLFVAVTNTDILKPWLGVIEASQAALAGVYLLPMVTEAVLAYMGFGQSTLLVVTWHNLGLRQSYFQNGKLRASRIAVHDNDGAPEHFFRDEIGKTRLYLNSLRLTARDERLDLLLIDPRDLLGGLQQLLDADPTLDCVRFGQDKLASWFPGILNNASSYMLHLLMLARRRPARSLAPDSVIRRYWQCQQRRLLYRISVVTLALSCAWIGTNVVLKHQAEAKIQEIERQIQLQRSAYQTEARSFPLAPASADDMGKAVELAAAIQRGNRTPERLMQTASRAMEHHPEIMLMRLDWYREGADPGGSTLQPSASNNGEHESGELRGEIKHFRGDYRSAVGNVQAFVGHLRQDREVESVSVTQLPLNARSSSVLSGNTLDTLATGEMRAEFGVRLTLKGRP
ncbi:MAG: hypothetical protein Q8O37_07880 [Sulfuricellaceae bacterium]|nr:hypothetical protein [Sulfuricellaceae bacterium]